MAENINLGRNVFDKNAFKNTIDTNFTQLVSVPDPTFFDINLATVEDFFILYDKLFYEIPKEGEISSHEYIVKRSGEYINYQQIDDTIQALLDEIAALRQEILDIQLASIDDNAISTQLEAGVPPSEIVQQGSNQ